MYTVVVVIITITFIYIEIVNIILLTVSYINLYNSIIIALTSITFIFANIKNGKRDTNNKRGLPA